MVEMEDKIVKVLSAFRITIPRSYRKDYDIKIGDSLKVIAKNGKLCLVPVDLIAKERRSN